MANITQMVNVLQAMVLTDGPRMLRTPTYHVFHLYRPFQGARTLPVQMRAPAYRRGGEATPSLSLSAAIGEDGVVHVGLANMDPNRGAQLELTLPGLAQGGVSGQIITADAMDAHNTFDQPDALTPQPFAGARWEGARLLIEAPAKSVIVLALTPPR
jgi:alpha-N-arabinofuranosidase